MKRRCDRCCNNPLSPHPCLVPTDWIYFIIIFFSPLGLDATLAFITLVITPSPCGIPQFFRHGSTYEKHVYSVRSQMISSRQIFSCTVLSVSSVFVSAACAFSLCSKAWSIFQGSVIPVPGLFTHSHLHQRSETSSLRCSCSKTMHNSTGVSIVCATQTRPSPWLTQLGPQTALCKLSKLPICPVLLPHQVVLTKLTHIQILSLKMRVCPAGDVPAVLWPLRWVGSPQNHPPPNQSTTKNRVESAACRRSLPLSFTSQEVSVEICVVEVYMLSPTLQRTVPFC